MRGPGGTSHNAMQTYSVLPSRVLAGGAAAVVKNDASTPSEDRADCSAAISSCGIGSPAHARYAAQQNRGQAPRAG